MKPGKAMIVAVRKRDFHGQAAGGVEAGCFNCGETVLLSRASQDRVQLGYKVACAQCVAKALGAQPDARPHIELPTAAEIADASGMTEKN